MTCPSVVCNAAWPGRWLPRSPPQRGSAAAPATAPTDHGCSTGSPIARLRSCPIVEIAKFGTTGSQTFGGPENAILRPNRTSRSRTRTVTSAAGLRVGGTGPRLESGLKAAALILATIIPLAPARPTEWRSARVECVTGRFEHFCTKLQDLHD